MPSARLPSLALFCALLACGPKIDFSGGSCSSDGDCAPGQRCGSGFLGPSCYAPDDSPSQPPVYSAGGAGGGGFGGFGASACSGQVCLAPVLPGLVTAPCCAAGDRCGVHIVGLSAQCVELDLPGAELPGCCRPSGWCGVLHAELGCADPTVLGGPPGPPCVVIDPGEGDASADGDDIDAGSDVADASGD